MKKYQKTHPDMYRNTVDFSWSGIVQKLAIMSTVVLLLPALAAYAKDGKQVTIQVVNTQSSERRYSTYVPGTAGSSSTNCTSNATANTYGNNTNVNGSTGVLPLRLALPPRASKPLPLNSDWVG
jgi:hypothetical protein